MIPSLTQWLQVSTAGMPRWGWGLIVLGVVSETIMGRSKDPRWRSLGDSIRNLLGMALNALPGGAPILRVLQALYLVPPGVQAQAILAEAREAPTPSGKVKLPKKDEPTLKP